MSFVRRLGWPALVLLIALTLAACRTTSGSASPATTPGSTLAAVPSAAVTAMPPTSAPTAVTESPPAGPTATTPPATTASASATAPATSPPTAALVAEGRQIFQTGIGPNGASIPRSAVPVGMMGGMMASAGCAACHGSAGQGARMPMFTAPDITYGNLTGPQGMLEPDGSRGPSYSEAQIETAIVAGVGADGQQLATTMPRWQMTADELDALLAYLKTLP